MTKFSSPSGFPAITPEARPAAVSVPSVPAAAGNPNLNANERKVLAFLAEDSIPDECCYCFAPIAEETKLEAREVRLACRSIKRKGLTEFHRGLWNDDGEPAGSGYSATRDGKARAKLEGLTQ